MNMIMKVKIKRFDDELIKIMEKLQWWDKYVKGKFKKLVDIKNR